MKAAQPPSVTIRQIEFELGMGLPYDAEQVMQLRNMLREAHKQAEIVPRAGGETRTAPKLSSALAAFYRRGFFMGHFAMGTMAPLVTLFSGEARNKIVAATSSTLGQAL